MGWLDRLLFWREDDTKFGVEGCFTLPGAELDAEARAIEVDDGHETPSPED